METKMNLKEIKKWREGNTYIHTTELAPMFDWLIAEVELLHSDGMTIYGMMEDGRAKVIAEQSVEIEKLKTSLAMAEDAAKKGDPVRNEAQATLDMAVARCAEIAGETSKLAEHRIKVEFGL